MTSRQYTSSFGGDSDAAMRMQQQQGAGAGNADSDGGEEEEEAGEVGTDYDAVAAGRGGSVIRAGSGPPA